MKKPQIIEDGPSGFRYSLTLKQKMLIQVKKPLTTKVTVIITHY